MLNVYKTTTRSRLMLMVAIYLAGQRKLFHMSPLFKKMRTLLQHYSDLMREFLNAIV